MNSSVAIKKVSFKDVSNSRKSEGYIKPERKASIDVMSILNIKHPQDPTDYAIQLLHKHLNHNCFIKVIDKQFKLDDMETAYVTLEKSKNILDDDNPRIENWEETFQINIRNGKIQRI